MIKFIEKYFPQQVLEYLVIQEAKALKQYATKDELSRLDFYNLDPDDGNKCIYGQMIGHCAYRRANELILKCATRVYSRQENLTKDIILNANH